MRGVLLSYKVFDSGILVVEPSYVASAPFSGRQEPLSVNRLKMFVLNKTPNCGALIQ
jgi:hypothetical protein